MFYLNKFILRDLFYAKKKKGTENQDKQRRGLYKENGNMTSRINEMTVSRRRG